MSWICGLMVKANSVLCSRKIHPLCAGQKMVAPKLSRFFVCSKCQDSVIVVVEKKD